MLANLALDALGLAAGCILFSHNPFLGKPGSRAASRSVSVIVPARDEAHTLPALLGSLARQTLAPLEIICVDDGSSDDTAGTARRLGARVLSAGTAPPPWLGKSWACMVGSQAAKGEILLFLDADVSLGPRAIEGLLGALPEGGGAASLQPYHAVERPYEHFSLFFNLAAIGANGLGLPWKARSAGLFGPVIMIDRKSYDAVGGHGSVKEEVAEDLALGRALLRKGIPYRLFLGGRDASYRMYRLNYGELRSGWTKNMAMGAARAPLLPLLLCVAWISAGASILADLFTSGSRGDLPMLLLAAGLYALYALLLGAAASRAGSFRKIALIIYPVWLAGFIALFAESLFLRWVLRRVSWKGRRIELRRRTCD